MKKLRRAVFLDRDGVLLPDHDYLADPAKAVPYKGTAEALKLLKKAGFVLVIVTNQSGIARGYFGWKDFAAVQAALRRRLAARGARWDALYVSPHGPDSRSPMRKPRPGMLLAARRDWKLDLKRSFLVGDKRSDIECGRRAGVTTVLVRTGMAGRDRGSKAKPDAVRRDILSAARWIIAR